MMPHGRVTRGLLLFGFLLAGWAVAASRCAPTRPLESLLATKEPLHLTAVVTPNGVAIREPLRIYSTFVPSTKELFSGSCARLTRSWTGGGAENGGPELYQHIERCTNPWLAMARRWVGRPEVQPHEPNFEGYDRVDHRPRQWTYRAKRFGNAHVVCGYGGANDGCMSWYYAARYRQYNVELHYFGPDQPILPAQFERVVAALMDQTEAAFEENK
jgi:hypothetical protein